MNQKKPLKICIVRLSALGDVLMIIPLIRTLQNNIPVGSKITWIISNPAYQLVSDLDDIEFVVINKPNSIKSLLQFRKLMQNYEFDILLATQASMRANLLYPFIKASRKVGYDKQRAKDFHRLFILESIASGNDHTVDGFLKFAEHIGFGSPPTIKWNIPIPEIDLNWVNSNLNLQPKSYIVINPASSKLERSWAVYKYVELIKFINNEFNIPVVLTGGPTPLDFEISNAILSQVSCINLVGKTKLKQLLAVIANARVVICPDTGPSHMACAVGTQVIALHAVTPSAVSGPYLYRDLAIDYYQDALKSLKITKPKWGQHAHGSHVMDHIAVADVIKKLNLILS